MSNDCLTNKLVYYQIIMRLLCRHLIFSAACSMLPEKQARKSQKIGHAAIETNVMFPKI